MGTVVWTTVGWMVSVMIVSKMSTWTWIEVRRTPLDNGLDGLVNVVVDVLASNHRCNSVCVSGFGDDTLILELSSLASETSLDLSSVTVLESAVLDSDEVVSVLLGKNLTIGDGLDGSVVVILVNLLVNGGGDLLVLGRSDGLVENSRCDALMNSGVVVTSLGPIKSVSDWP